jgi:hypothetical protein
MTLRQVTTIQQRGDDTILVYVQTDSFTPGQEVEVSVYLTQGEAYAAHIEKKRIPLPDSSSNTKQPAVLHVELPATKLNADQEVTVISRVAEVWPSVLQQDLEKLGKIQGVLGAVMGATEDPGEGLKAVWTYQDSEGKGSGDPGSPSSGNAGGRVTTLRQGEPTA